MSDPKLIGKRVLITHADVFMGPALCEAFAAHGATVIAATDSLLSPGAPASVLAAAGEIDVLVANLAISAPSTGRMVVWIWPICTLRPRRSVSSFQPAQSLSAMPSSMLTMGNLSASVAR